MSFGVSTSPLRPRIFSQKSGVRYILLNDFLKITHKLEVGSDLGRYLFQVLLL